MSLNSVIKGLSPSSYWTMGAASGTTETDQVGTVTLTDAGGFTLGVTGLATADATTATRYDGSTGKAQAPAGTYLESANQAFTWFAVVSVATWSPTSGNYWRILGSDWYNSTQAANGGVALIGYTDANGNHLEGMRANDATKTADYLVTTLPSASAANAWATATTYDVALSYDNGGTQPILRLYVNGDLVASMVSTLSVPTAPSGVGFSVASSGQGGNCGAITAQHVARWGSALSGLQIAQLHQARINQSLTSATSLYCGAWISGARATPTLIDNFNTLAGRQVGIINDFYDLVQNPSPSVTFAQAVNQRNATYMVTLEPWDSSGANTANYTCANVATGNYDGAISTWASQIKQMPGQVLVRLAHEANGNWYPWGCQGGNNGNTPAQYVSMWKHIQSVFASAGCTNVKWVWCPISYYTGSTTYAPLYPGDAFVDFVGLDGYNWGNNVYNGVTYHWQTGYDIFSLSRTLIGQITAKGILICETAAAEANQTSGQTKAGWITQFLSTELPQALPQCVGVVWFEQNKEEDWRVESDSAAQSAYLSATSASLYGAGPFLVLSSTTTTTTTTLFGSVPQPFGTLVSPYGQTLQSYLPPYYQASKLLASILQVEGAQFDQLYSAVSDLLNQWFPATATWTLGTWETILGLPPNPSLTTDSGRQQRIIALLSSNATATIEKVVSVANTFNDGQITVVEDFAAYTVILSFVSQSGLPANITDFQNAMRNLIPAHLGISYVFRYLTWDRLDSYNWTWNQLDSLGLTWDQLSTYVK